MLFHAKVFETRDERLYQEVLRKLDSHKIGYKVKVVDTNNKSYESLDVRPTMKWANFLDGAHDKPVLNEYMVYVKKEDEAPAISVLHS